MKQVTFNNINYTTNTQTDPNTVTIADISANMKTIHQAIVTKLLTKRNNNRIDAHPSSLCLLCKTDMHTHTTPPPPPPHTQHLFDTHTISVITLGFVDGPRSGDRAAETLAEQATGTSYHLHARRGGG